MVDLKPGEQKVYEASDGRKTVLSLMFLVFLPFLISLPIMFLIRGWNGFWLDALSAGITGAVFLAGMGFLFSHVMCSMRTRIAFADDALKIRVPSYRGSNPGLRFVRRTIPYDEIDRIERRGEIYSMLRVPVLTNATAVVLKTGERIVLGYNKDYESDPHIDFPTIAGQLARIAGVDIVDRGHVMVGSQLEAIREGEGPAWDAPPISDAEFSRLKSRNTRVRLGLALVLLALFGAGFLYDLARSNALQTTIQSLMGSGA